VRPHLLARQRADTHEASGHAAGDVSTWVVRDMPRAATAADLIFQFIWKAKLRHWAGGGRGEGLETGKIT